MGLNIFFFFLFFFFEKLAAGSRTGRCDNKWGSGGMLPPKNLKFRSSEMQFAAFWASKRVLFSMIILIDQ